MGSDKGFLIAKDSSVKKQEIGVIAHSVFKKIQKIKNEVSSSNTPETDEFRSNEPDLVKKRDIHYKLTMYNDKGKLKVVGVDRVSRQEKELIEAKCSLTGQTYDLETISKKVDFSKFLKSKILDLIAKQGQIREADLMISLLTDQDLKKVWESENEGEVDFIDLEEEEGRGEQGKLERRVLGALNRMVLTGEVAKFVENGVEGAAEDEDEITYNVYY